KKAIEGIQVGISKDVKWQGGGSFVYAELYDLNNNYLMKIQEVATEEQLDLLIKKMEDTAYFNFRVDFEKLKEANKDFQVLSLEEKKDILIKTLDMNQLYLSYTEIDDEQYEIDEKTRQFNHHFYRTIER